MTHYPMRFCVDTVLPSDEPWSIATWLFPPEVRLPVLPVLMCLPGGCYDKTYWHLEVPGYAPDAYSFARYMAKRGCLVVALDHLGTGESSRPAQGRRLTAERIAAANNSVVQQVRSGLQEGNLLPHLEAIPNPERIRMIGVGHSMGAYLALVEQAFAFGENRCDALAILGWTSIGEIGLQGAGVQAGAALGQALSADATLNEVAAFIPRELEYVESLKPLLHLLFYADDIPQAVIEADEAQGTVLPVGVMEGLCDVGYVQSMAHELRCPLFLANGTLDVSHNFHAETSAYHRSPDIVLFELAHSAHCQNFASNRGLLWARLFQWVTCQGSVQRPKGGVIHDEPSRVYY